MKTSAGSEYPLGSREDFSFQIDALGLPASWSMLGEYFHDPPQKRRRRRPGLVRWFSIEGSLEQAKSDIVSCFQRAGMAHRVVTVREIVHGNDDTYIFFVTLDPAMIAKNPQAPPGTQVEVSAKVSRGVKNSR